LTYFRPVNIIKKGQTNRNSKIEDTGSYDIVRRPYMGTSEPETSDSELNSELEDWLHTNQQDNTPQALNTPIKLEIDGTIDSNRTTSVPLSPPTLHRLSRIKLFH